MPVLPGDSAGMRRIAQILEAGRPVVLPPPTPLPYVVAGTDAASVNRAKARPDAQAVGMLVADFVLVRPHVCLDDDTFDVAGRLAAAEQVNLFLPIHPEGPAWLAPSTSGGLLGVTVACLDRFRSLIDRPGHLYLSSGNRTGEPVAVTAAAADEAFGGELTVLDGDALRDHGVPSGSATIVRVGPNRRFDVVRRGIQDAGAPDAEEYLRAALARVEAPAGKDY